MKLWAYVQPGTGVLELSQRSAQGHTKIDIPEEMYREWCAANDAQQKAEEPILEAILAAIREPLL